MDVLLYTEISYVIHCCQTARWVAIFNVYIQQNRLCEPRWWLCVLRWV